MIRFSHRRYSGFTLIELMITVAIVAILATIAYASYSFAVIKGRRSTAAGCLQERAQYMERYYTTNLTYLDAPQPAQCDSVSNFYTLAFVEQPTATAFEISATPQGGQASGDTKCGTLTINQRGERTASGTASDSSECW